ncbi:hypothetical protein NLJ89_g6188 [Agrocybe chaxingu]|uniref:Alcohol dehydrogenase-like C-terminal domain-containing protein n=1 Tax=Agrocybe chaxingu TaxID=84603 RepID=A0A9W8MW93_9AGAR|nr:hypothetical protein NLJ89_g6188 [Agrocybe chaxingu]
MAPVINGRVLFNSVPSAVFLGEVVFVSVGAGCVGSLVIQLAKAEGLKVIASAGLDEKVQFMKGLGADVTFNYKVSNMGKVLKREGPIDVYWDNVSGEMLEAALHNANNHARFIVPPSALVVYGLYAKYADAFCAEVMSKLASGEIKHRAHGYDGLERAGEAMRAVHTGANEEDEVCYPCFEVPPIARTLY